MMIAWAGASQLVLLPATFFAGVAVIGGAIGCNAYVVRVYPTYIRATGVGWALGVGRLGSILGVTIGGMMLSAGWQTASLFQASALPQLGSALVIVGLALFYGLGASSPRSWLSFENSDRGQRPFDLKQQEGKLHES